MTDLEKSVLGDIQQRIEAIEAEEGIGPSIQARLRRLADWLRINGPLLPPARQMAEFAATADTLEALADEVREIEQLAIVQMRHGCST